MARKKEDNSTSNGVLEAGAGAYAGKKLLDKGYIDGRTTLYHGTSEDAANKIRKVGLKAKYTAKGSSEAKQIMGLLPDDIRQKSKGHTFLTGNRLSAAEYSSQHRSGGSRELMHGKTFRNMRDHYTGVKKGIVKARVPLYMKKTIVNPEAIGSYGEYIAKNKDMREAFIPCPNLFQINLSKSVRLRALEHPI